MSERKGVELTFTNEQTKIVQENIFILLTLQSKIGIIRKLIETFMALGVCMAQ